MAKDAVAKSWTIKPSYDGKRYSAYQNGDFPSSFTTTFAANETPISEGGKWIKNSTLNQRVITTGGVATNDAQNSNNDDAYAMLATTAFKSSTDDYEITCTVGPQNGSMEQEILARLTDNSTQYFCYELLMNGSGYAIVQINGGFGGFYKIMDGTGGTPNTVGSLAASIASGDKIRFRVTGTNPVRLQAWNALAATPTVFTQFLDVNDSTANRKQTGQPGIAFYSATAGQQGTNSWSDFTVTVV